MKLWFTKNWYAVVIKTQPERLAAILNRHRRGNIQLCSTVYSVRFEPWEYMLMNTSCNEGISVTAQPVEKESKEKRSSSSSLTRIAVRWRVFLWFLVWWSLRIFNPPPPRIHNVNHRRFPQKVSADELDVARRHLFRLACPRL